MGDHVVAAVQQPRESELRRRAGDLLGDGAHALDELEVVREVLSLEARVAAPEVVRVELPLGGRRAESAGRGRVSLGLAPPAV